MDNPPSEWPADRSPVCRFGPSRRVTIVFAIAAVLAAGAVVTLRDPAGRLLIGAAAIVLTICAGADLFFSPRLVASAAGIRVNSPSMRMMLTWDQIVAVRIDTSSHFGLTATTLELDVELGGNIGDERLLVFSKRALGRDPQQVQGILASFGARTV